MDVHVRARPERGSGEASGGMLTPHLLWVAFKRVIKCVCVCVCMRVFLCVHRHTEFCLVQTRAAWLCDVSAHVCTRKHACECVVLMCLLCTLTCLSMSMCLCMCVSVCECECVCLCTSRGRLQTVPTLHSSGSSDGWSHPSQTPELSMTPPPTMQLPCWGRISLRMSPGLPSWEVPPLLRRGSALLCVPRLVAPHTQWPLFAVGWQEGTSAPCSQPGVGTAP